MSPFEIFMGDEAERQIADLHVVKQDLAALQDVKQDIAEVQTLRDDIARIGSEAVAEMQRLARMTRLLLAVCPALAALVLVVALWVR